MFLNKNNIIEILIIFGISIYAFFVNWMSGNIGIIPIDSFGFLDPGHSILHGKLPIRDFWIFTGLLVDYMEAFFLLIFGNNWNSHLIHASSMNILIVLVFYFFLKDFKIQKIYVSFYCIALATLCYPVSGTPFAYIHSYIFSLISIMLLIIAVKNKSQIIWFILPFVSIFSFLSMQTPSTYILLILFFVIAYYFFTSKDFKNLKFFLIGCIISLLFFIVFLLFTDTPFTNFLYQYILFPLTIGEGRISNSEMAYVSLVDQINFKRLLGDFKFIHIFLITLIYLTLKSFRSKRKIITLTNITVIASVFAFLFNQLITANQIYIFSLIPIIAAVIQINIKELGLNPKILFLILFIVLFATTKFHLRYNVDRKFHDIENLDKSLALEASEIHPNLKNLKWLTKNDEPSNEVRILKIALDKIKDEKREVTLITHYQFFSTVLNKNLNILNRWYLWDNNTHPTENHKHFNVYKSLINKNIVSNNIEVIYLLGQENEISFNNIKNYFTDVCFKSTTLVENRFSAHEIVNCNK